MGLAISPSLEREFFRRLNAVVEPAVRCGIGSPRLAPAGLILLETTGFKSGLKRRTPLVAIKLRGYILAATARGERSFWVKNLRKKSKVNYWRGGKEYEAKSFVIAPGKRFRRPASLPDWLAAIAQRLAPLTGQGWAFVILTPIEQSVDQ